MPTVVPSAVPSRSTCSLSVRISSSPRPLVPGSAGGVFHEPESRDLDVNVAVVECGLDAHRPRLAPAVRVLGTVAARLVDHQHDVRGERLRHTRAAKPRSELMSHVTQPRWNRVDFNDERWTWMAVQHDRDIVVVTDGGRQFVEHRVGNRVDRQFDCLRHHLGDTGDSCVDRFITPLDEPVGVEHQGRSAGQCRGGLRTRLVSVHGQRHRARIRQQLRLRLGRGEHRGDVPGAAVRQGFGPGVEDRDKYRGAERIWNEGRHRIELFEQPRRRSAPVSSSARAELRS